MASMLNLLAKAEPLSKVVFIYDYIQLGFQGGYGLTLWNPVTINCEGASLKRDSAGFCDVLCSLIGQRVISVSYREHEKASFVFESGKIVTVSLAPQDFSGSEAFMLSNDEGLMVVE